MFCQHYKASSPNWSKIVVTVFDNGVRVTECSLVHCNGGNLF
jgi:hypothetical protein